MTDDIDAIVAAKDEAYRERNRLVILIAKMAMTLGWRAGVGSDLSQNEDWRTVVYVDLPTGQASWHLPSSERGNLPTSLPEYKAPWDGHSTNEKYRRIGNVAVGNDGYALRAQLEEARAARLVAGATLGKIRCIVDKQGTDDDILGAVRDLRTKLAIATEALREIAKTSGPYGGDTLLAVKLAKDALTKIEAKR